MTRIRKALLTVPLVWALSGPSFADLIITEVVDGPMTAGQPKWAELTNTGDSSVILGGFSFGIKANGGMNLSGGSAMVLNGSLAPGESLVISFETDTGPGNSVFFSVYGQDPDVHSGASTNGDDVVLLYQGAATGDGSDATLIDVYGEEGVDGTGTVWEYEDSYARRCGDTGNFGVFDPMDWEIPGPGALETGCSDDACYSINLQAMTDPWVHSGCLTTGPGSPYCTGDQGTCPCTNDNDASNGPAGCANGSHTGGASLTAGGSASLSTADMVLQASGIPPTQPSIFFQGNNAINGGVGRPFGGGLRCAGGAAVRLQILFSDSVGVSSTAVDIGAVGGVSPGDIKRYQLWYQDPAPVACGGGFNLTNAYEVAWSA